MNAFFQFLLNNGPMFAGFVWLFFKITKLEHKIELEHKDIIVMLKGHDHDIKKMKKNRRSIKKRVDRLEKKVNLA